MLLSGVLPILALGLSSCGLAASELTATTSKPTKTILAERQILTSVAVSKCTTGTSGVVTPAPSGAVCGVAAVSNGGVLQISYTSGTNVQSLDACGTICLATSGCTNIYFALNQYCNLHSGVETHVATSGSIYSFYDATCFSCSALTNTATTTTSTTSAVVSCTTNALGLASPQPSGAVCDVLAVSNGGTTIISYSSGEYILSLALCKDICLTTVGCTNIYFAEGQYCNLHAGAETHVESSSSIYSFYDSTCFICPSTCSSSSTPPEDAVCDVLAYSSGGTTIISYTSGTYIENINACSAICLATTGCTNLYFEPNVYCNLHSGNETHFLDSSSPYQFYDASCFDCSETTIATTTSSSSTSKSTSTATSTASSCTVNSLGLATPQPSGAVCDVIAYSNGGTTIISYTSGDYITSLASCSAICLATSGCTNLYFWSGTQCNLHSGTETHNPDSSSPYVFYDASCFSCTSPTTSSATDSATSTTSQITETPWTSIETNPAKYNMAVTTTFTQASQCTGTLITQMAWRGTNLWENAINPVPTSTITTCYPSQFYSSVMGALNSVALPAFSTLVCPSGWTANMYNSTYGACCPNNFGVYAPYYTDVPDRPFSGAACTSIMPPYQVYDLTSYDSTAYLTAISTSAPAAGTLVRVNAFDGMITGLPASTTSSLSTTAKASSTATCSSPAATVSVTFKVQYLIPTDFDGETISLVGSTTELGSWNVTDSQPMSSAFYTLSNPIWDLTVAFNASEVVQYQYLLNYANGTYTATSEPYYNLTVSAGCPTTQSVNDVWR